ncbi:MAG: hypothetical protein MZV63_19900 [Marinilabiliales bacterium]|nr:hypothetical protein [Marinilabiliales bacterium]
MVVLSTRTGYPQAVLLDNGYLTDVRTALAGRGRREAPGAQARADGRRDRRRHPGPLPGPRAAARPVVRAGAGLRPVAGGRGRLRAGDARGVGGGFGGTSEARPASGGPGLRRRQPTPRRSFARATSSSPARHRTSRSSGRRGCTPACTSRRWAPTSPRSRNSRASACGAPTSWRAT